MKNGLSDLEKKCIDLDYIYLRDKIVKFLFDNDLYYSLYDLKKIRRLLNLLLKYLEKGEE